MNEISLIDYFDRAGIQYRRTGSSTYELEEHDSFKFDIEKNTFNWFSRGIGGRSAWDYVKKVEFNGNATNKEIADRIKQVMGEQSLDDGSTDFKPVEHSAEIKDAKSAERTFEKGAFKLPAASTSTRQLKQYLCNERGLAETVVNAFIATRQLYESNVPKEINGRMLYIHNAVFVRFDESGVPVAAHQKGLRVSKDGTKFSGDVPNSAKEANLFTFPLNPPESTTSIFLCEAEVDLMSFLTLQLEGGRQWNQFCCGSLGGVNKQQSITTGLEKFLDSHPNIETVVIGFDKDETGQLAAESLKGHLIERGITDVRIQIPKDGIDGTHCKDWNDCLVQFRKGNFEISNKRPERRGL